MFLYKWYFCCFRRHGAYAFKYSSFVEQINSNQHFWLKTIIHSFIQMECNNEFYALIG